MKPARNGWASEKLWDQLKANFPIPCVDVIVSNRRGEVMLGWRVIRPYVNVWAFPGGRIRFGENLTVAAHRILALHRIKARDFCLVGVFPIRFPSRFDVSICLATKHYSGKPVPDGAEFTRVGWFRTLPRGTGRNYRMMMEKWKRMRCMPKVIAFNRL